MLTASVPGPDEFNSNTAGFVENHVFPRSVADGFWHELHVDTGISAHSLGDFVKLRFAGDFKREMMQADILPEVEFIDAKRVVYFPQGKAYIPVTDRRTRVTVISPGFFPAKAIGKKCDRLIKVPDRKAKMVNALRFEHVEIPQWLALLSITVL